MANTEDRVKHLEMIQAIVSRMAANSFLIKGWCVTIVAALLALSGKDSDKRFLIVAFYPVLMFWCLDGYFLWQERLFRDLYNAVRQLPDDKITFEMETSSYKKETTFLDAVGSRTLLLFYLTMIVAIVIVYLILFLFS